MKYFTNRQAGMNPVEIYLKKTHKEAHETEQFLLS